MLKANNIEIKKYVPFYSRIASLLIIINNLLREPNCTVYVVTIEGVSHYHVIAEVWPMIHCKLQKFAYHSKTNFRSFYND